MVADLKGSHRGSGGWILNIRSFCGADTGFKATLQATMPGVAIFSSLSEFRQCSQKFDGHANDDMSDNFVCFSSVDVVPKRLHEKHGFE